jgi:ABC-2 type transport system ATP-binding protein
MIHMKEVAKYFGDKRALGPVSFEIPPGHTVGFLGLNGVGKTTLLRILACDLRPSAGTARVAGADVLEDPHSVRQRVGYLPETPPLYRDMTVGDYLGFVGRIKGLERAAVARRVPEVEETTHLEDAHDELIRHLSHGYRQRVGVAQAIIHDPQVLVLDEPTNGLDPVQIRQMRELIRRLGESHTILISSHILPEISETCDELLILDDGEIVASGTEDELSHQVLRFGGLTVDVVLPEAATADADPASGVLALVEKVPGVETAQVVERDSRTLTLRVDGEGDLRAPVNRALVESGHDVVRLDRAHRELERVFVELVGGRE